MRFFTTYRHTLLIAFALTALIISCKDKPSSEKVVGKVEKEKQADLKEILERQKLVILAENSANSYFIYRGAKMGLEYDILYQFSKHLGVDLEVKVVKNLDKITNLLNNGDGDIIACNYTVTKERLKEIDFSTPIMRTPQVLVQRKPDNWRERKYKDWKKELINDPVELAHKRIHVWKNSSYYNRLIHLQEEIGDTILIEPLDGDLIPEELLEMVSEGFINYTVIDQNVAQINKRFYPNLDIELPLSIRQKIAFGVRKSSPLLKERLNEWLKSFMKTSTFRYIINKYLKTTSSTSKAKTSFSSIKGDRISVYDEIVKKIADDYGWDWLLVTSLMYQESKFINNAESWAGAYGLMQFMPKTGPEYGVYPDSPPHTQIRGGVRKLNKHYKYWESIPDSVQRIKFTLATYNAGLGHILDAQRLASKHNLDSLVWDNNVERMILKLSKPKYYYDKAVRHGYLRGQETYNYVRSIMTRHNEYVTAFRDPI